VQGGGTSAAAPLWAGFMALANQQAANNQVGRVGFVNPVLYEIGLTSGLSGASNLYATSFNDVADGKFNSDNAAVKGFPAVAGYDLATGWGSPQCGLIQQLATFNPAVPGTYSVLDVHIANGADGLNPVTGATLDVFYVSGGQSPTYTLKPSGAMDWQDNGVVHEFPLQLQDSAGNPISIPATGIDHVVLNLLENGQGSVFGTHDDNWDVAGLGIRLANPGSPEACEIDLSGNQGCIVGCAVNGSSALLGDGHPGVVRLSGADDMSGSGPSVPFAAGQCFRGSAPDPAPGTSTEPLSSLELVFDTGTDSLRSDSELDVDIFDVNGNDVFHDILSSSGGPELQEDTEASFIDQLQNEPNPQTQQIQLPSGLNLANISGCPATAPPNACTIQVSVVSHDTNCPLLVCEGNDTWRLYGARVWGYGPSSATSGAAQTCLGAQVLDDNAFTDGSPIVFTSQAGCAQY